MLPPLLAAAASAADCPVPVAANALLARLDAAEDAYADLDVDAFTTAADAVALELPCLEEPVTIELAARVHRIRALLQWGDANEAAARRSLAALKRITPAETLPVDLVPSGHALHQALAQADATTWDVVPEPVEGDTLSFDGTPGARPAHQPTIAQHLRGEEVDWTVLLAPDAALPEYDARRAAADRRSPTTALLLTSAGSAVAAGAAFGGAILAKSAFNGYDPAVSVTGADAYDGARSRRNLANGLTVGAGSLGAVAVGAAVAALVTR